MTITNDTFENEIYETRISRTAETFWKCSLQIFGKYGAMFRIS